MWLGYDSSSNIITIFLHLKIYIMEYISFTFSFYKMNIAHIKSDNKIFLIIVATSFH